MLAMTVDFMMGSDEQMGDSSSANCLKETLESTTYACNRALQLYERSAFPSPIWKVPSACSVAVRDRPRLRSKMNKLDAKLHQKDKQAH